MLLLFIQGGVFNGSFSFYWGYLTQAGLFDTFIGRVTLWFKSWLFEPPDWELVSLCFSSFLTQGGWLSPLLLFLAHGAKLPLFLAQKGCPVEPDWLLLADGLITPSLEVELKLLFLTQEGWFPWTLLELIYFWLFMLETGDFTSFWLLFFTQGGWLLVYAGLTGKLLGLLLFSIGLFLTQGGWLPV